jgi:cell division protease FtsH
MNIPDYAGIVPSIGTLGQVSASYEFLASIPSIGIYKYKRHLVRVLLAGRAAEQLTVGIEDMSVTSARSDLRHATDIAKDLIGRYGISPTMEDESTAGSNLLLKIGTDVSDTEKHRIENAARLFLSRQYDVVLDQLRAHRVFLEAIADRLVKQKILDKGHLKSMAIEYGVLNESAA